MYLVGNLKKTGLLVTEIKYQDLRRHMVTTQVMLEIRQIWPEP